MAYRLLGSFAWCELMTTDTAAADSFYKRVVGWTSKPFAPDGSYIVFNNPSGAGVAGLMKLPDQVKQMGVPPQPSTSLRPGWMMYIGTPNVDDTAARIVQLGGRVHKPAEDIPTVGRFAVVQDPYGASFAIFTPAPMPGQPERNETPGLGDFSWFELYTPNPEGAWTFYETLFGWEKTSAMDMGEAGTYQMYGRGGGIPRGGIMKPPPGAPAAWLPYARVKDAKAAAATATANGSKIVVGPMEVPGGDWIFQAFDQQGAMFAVHSLNPAAATAAAPPATKNAKKTKAAKTVTKKKASAKKTVARVNATKKKAVKRSAKPAKKKPATKKAGKKKAPKKPKKK